jgi:hypothetical protein
LRLVAVLVLVAVGCGGTPSCEHAFGKAAKTIGSNANLVVLTDVCTTLKFSDDTRRCIASASSEDEVETCAGRDPSWARNEARQQQADRAVDRAHALVDDAQNKAKDATDSALALEALSRKVDAATDALAAAQNDAQRAAAKAMLDQLRSELEKLETRHRQDRAAEDEAVRTLQRCAADPDGSGCS